MHRRSFFASLGAVAAAPLVGCSVRDAGTTSAPTDDQGLAEFRAFTLPEVEPALPFRPLRRMPRK